MSSSTRLPDDSAPPPWAAGTETRSRELFPTLTESQLHVLQRAGTECRFADDDWVWQVGNRSTPLYAVLDGYIEAVRRDIHGDSVVATFHRAQFTGETTTMAGRASHLAGRARGDVRAIAVPQERLRELMSVNAELGELLIHAFILRRMRMIAEHAGPITLIGSRYSADTLRLRDFLTRNGTPHEYVDLEHAEDVDALLEQFDVRADSTPIVLCNGRVLLNPSLEVLAECLGTSPTVSSDTLYDVAVVGAGPGGLATAVYAASEGLKVVVLERLAPGGQAGTSSRIENYLGFPTGISGQALAGRGWNQAQKFGAEFAIPREVAAVSYAGAELRVALSGTESVRARSVVIASGVVYRQPQLPGIERFMGSHVHHSASYLESLLCRGQEVVVLGGGNSAGQAAVFLSGHAQQVYLLVRGKGLADSMSRYLIARIANTPNIALLAHTELTAVEGETTLESVRWRNASSGEETSRPVHHVFVFIGAVPCTDYLDRSIARDAQGYIKTGTALSAEERGRYRALGERQPQNLETSWPNVFAIGDVRSGSLKRVTTAAGEGAAVVSQLHELLT